MFKHYLAGSTALGVVALLSAQPAMAQLANTAQKSAPKDAATLEEIVVTAEKREQSLSKVPMSITAATAEQLRDAGVTEVRDLVKITPGLTYADSTTGTPIYTIRGVGFSDFALAGRPTVSVYADQAPIPFSIETRGVSLDLERVEVLKGPQGTLFGTNSTGGAINFIAAKPTRTFESGADVSFGRFNSREVSGFLSGPITSTLSARLALGHDGEDDWQKSYTTGQKTGAKDFWNSRLSLDWAPSDRLHTSLTVNGWIDHSDTQATQLIAYAPSTPFDVPELQTYPVAPRDARAAEFDLGRDFEKDNTFIQTNFRLDYDLTDELTLTSLSSYANYHADQLDDLDGTTVSNNYFATSGKLRSVSQELRLAGSFATRGHFTVGVNYVEDATSEINPTYSPVSSISNLFSTLAGMPLPVNFVTSIDADSTTEAAFASLDYDLTDSINIYAGARYTDFQTDFSGCLADSGDGVTATIFGTVPGECVTLTRDGVPGVVHTELTESNTSWRAGAQWTAAPDVMLYANVSKGYKAGSFPVLPATDYHQFDPVKQESVLAYEAGFKAGLFNRALQLNGAIFEYEYSDKQLLGSAIIPNVGTVLRLVNLPKSRVEGAEFELTAVPVWGLRISAAATYVSSEVTRSFLNIDPLGAPLDFKGQPFPNTPQWQLSSDVGYEWPLNDRLKAFVGANASYQSSTNSQFGELPLFDVDSYTLLDLRAGLESADGRWRATMWGRNVTDTYYWSSATRGQDAVVRYAGQPATYGISLSFRYQ